MITLGLSLVSGGAFSFADEAPARRATAEVRRGTIQHRMPTIGTFRARRVTRLGSEVSGRVSEVLVEEGDSVELNQPLVRLDSKFFDLAVRQRRTNVETAEARLESADAAIRAAEADVALAKASLAEGALTLERMRNLWKKPNGSASSIPKGRYDAARFAHDRDLARLRAAEARLAQVTAARTLDTLAVRQAEEALEHAVERLAETVIRAPYRAVVTQRLVDPGERVTATPITRLIEVQDTVSLELEFSLPQELLALVGPATPIDVEVEGTATATFKATIERIYPTLEATTRAFRCRVIVANEGHELRPGMLARILVVDKVVRDALIVPRAALSRTTRGWKALVQTGDGNRPRTVEIGLLTDTEAQVIRGLALGERVVLP